MPNDFCEQIAAAYPTPFCGKDESAFAAPQSRPTIREISMPPSETIAIPAVPGSWALRMRNGHAAKDVVLFGSDQDVVDYLNRHHVHNASDILKNGPVYTTTGIAFHRGHLERITAEGDTPPAKTAALPKHIDAVVLTRTNGNGFETAATLKKLRSLKNQYPEMAVLVNGFAPKAVLYEGNPHEKSIVQNSFCIPGAEVKTNNRDPLMIKGGDPVYVLAPPIDMFCYQSKNVAGDLAQLLQREKQAAASRS